MVCNGFPDLNLSGFHKQAILIPDRIQAVDGMNVNSSRVKCASLLYSSKSFDPCNICKRKTS